MGLWGCGAWHGTDWIQLPWDSQSEALPIMLPIMPKELLAVLLACAVWSLSWSHHCVTVLCNNQAVVACLWSWSCHDHHIMHMHRTLAFIEVSFAFTINPQYINTAENYLADHVTACYHSYQRSHKLIKQQHHSNAIGGATSGPRHGLDVSAMAPSVQRYFQDGLATSTRRVYGSAMKRFSTFCGYRVTYPFPVSEFVLCAFAAYLADQNLSPQTIKSYVTAIRNTQLLLGLPDPRELLSHPILKRVQAGISWSRLGRGQMSKVRLPITAPTLHRIKRQLDIGAHRDTLVFWAVCCTAYIGFFRLGELLFPSAST